MPAADAPPPDPLAWPAITRDCRPWSYWWWLGSAVDKPNLTRELQRYHDAGWGGVHIIPIYGAKGWEDKYIPYLSPQWMDMLRHTVSEAQRLGLGVDMTTGSGWCFGGPNVSDREANASAVVKTVDVAAGARLKDKFDRAATQALIAFSPQGEAVDLTGKISADGLVDWTAEGGTWRVFAVSQKPSRRMVKRAAPGGEGHMLNLFYSPGVAHYLQRFTEAFAQYDGPRPRAMYHDSYEYQSDWSPDLLAQFEKRRGYRLQNELPALFGKEEDDHVARVKSDYRETISDILVEDSLPVWVRWSHEQGFLTRNQAHGSPGNLLDLYALVDMPETEMFNQDRSVLVSKFASSAAHVAGRRRVVSETGTWLKEHFTEQLADVKYLMDDLFVAGVNHVTYHGTCYSPDEAGWPGWLFYASTELNPRNSIWRDVPALNAYAARCQAILQSGRSDNDVLVYWPVHDVWHNPKGRIQQFSVHARFWLEDQTAGRTAEELWRRGFTFDFVSDRQLADAKVRNGRVETPGGAYRAVLVPPCEHMPAATFEQLLALADGGGTILFEDHLPNDVPGLGALEQRRARFKQLRESVKLTARTGRPAEAKRGKGHVLVGEVEASLAAAGVAREPMTDHAGIQFVRRAFDGGRHYFIANRGELPLDDWVALTTTAASVIALDPMSGRTGIAALRRDRAGHAQVHLQLLPGQSMILRTLEKQKANGPAWSYWRDAGEPVEITGTWQVRFLQGGPQLPAPFTTARLASWTGLGDTEAQRFAGTALYTIAFDAPSSSASHWVLDLGQVCQSARVRLNGLELGTVFLPPFRVVLDQLKAKGNVLEVEVTNVSANRIRDLDQRGVKWRNFHDINLVNMDYKPFDASKWPLTDSGLLGPVRLVPQQKAVVK